MHTPLVSRRRAKVLSFAIFLIGLAIVSYLNIWWPGIMLAIGIPLAMRQYLLGRHLRHARLHFCLRRRLHHRTV